MWYQTFNSFGEIVFCRQWSEDKAYPTLILTMFYCGLCAPWHVDGGEWVAY